MNNDYILKDLGVNLNLHENTPLALAVNEYIHNNRSITGIETSNGYVLRHCNMLYNTFVVNDESVSECRISDRTCPGELLRLYQKHCYETNTSCELIGTKYHDEDVWLGDDTKYWYWETKDYTIVPTRMTERQVRNLPSKYTIVTEMGIRYKDKR